MPTDKTTRRKPLILKLASGQKCPCCGLSIPAVRVKKGAGGPGIVVCTSCGALIKRTKDGLLRRLTPEEKARLKDHQYYNLIKADHDRITANMVG